MKQKVTILGAGIAGLSAAYHLKKNQVDTVIYEKNSAWGGLCGNFTIDEFRFDKFIHLSFSQNQYVRELFANSTQYRLFQPEPLCYYHGYWMKHPAQNNLYNLPVHDKIPILKGFISRKNTSIAQINNYEDWLRVQYGDCFAEQFPMVYTKKYWTVDAKHLETKWIGSRMYIPTIDEVLEGALTDNTPNTYYAKEMRYPVKGGFQSFLDGMAQGQDIRLCKKVIDINVKEKKIRFDDGSMSGYDYLVSSIPLPHICTLISNCPRYVSDAAKNLKWTSGALISIGLRRPPTLNHLWFYIYNQNILASRIYLPGEKSADNVPPGCGSIQAEVFFSNEKPLGGNPQDILENEISQYIAMGLFSREDIRVKDIRIENYANIVFDHQIYENRKICLDYLKEQEIFSIGRFGEWEYYWSDQSLLSGMKVVDAISNLVKHHSSK